MTFKRPRVRVKREVRDLVDGGGVLSRARALARISSSLKARANVALV